VKTGIIGQLTSKELLPLQAEFKGVEFPMVTSEGFEPWLNTKEDRAEARRHGVKAAHFRAIIKRNCYSQFSSSSLDSGFKIFMNRFSQKLEDDFCYEGFYAAMHDDKHISANMQIMFTVENVGGHRLYSEDFGMIVPQAGDIIRLNTYRLHAVFPAPGLSASKCLANPFRFYAVTYRRQT